MNPVGSRVTALMDRQHMKVSHLAKEADVSVPYIYEIKKGTAANPSRDKLEAIAKALGTSVNFLLFGTESSVESMPASSPQFVVRVPMTWEWLPVELRDPVEILALSAPPAALQAAIERARSLVSLESFRHAKEIYDLLLHIQRCRTMTDERQPEPDAAPPVPGE